VAPKGKLDGLFQRFFERLRWVYKTRVAKDPFWEALSQWYRDEGDTTLRLSYPINSDSVVFDVGGYLGDWSYQIAQRYDPYIFIFEPVPAFCLRIKERFRSNTKVKVFNYGLSDTDEDVSITMLEDGSSTFRSGRDKITVRFADIEQFVRRARIETIDLIKINIEGGEYRLLQKMLDSGVIGKCKDIQVQFHSFVPAASELRDQIRRRLVDTHCLTFDYYFVWENWRRKDLGKVEKPCDRF
jgi:FkbM family methyltransferase